MARIGTARCGNRGTRDRPFPDIDWFGPFRGREPVDPTESNIPQGCQQTKCI
jgi:hypothetical protein